MNDSGARLEALILSQRLLKKGDAVLVAVSGGLDSMVLLNVLSRLEPNEGWKLHVVHFNHQLRGKSSDADECLVRKTAERLAIPFTAGKADVRFFAAEQKTSIEMAARTLRHQFFADTARRNRIRKIALAHHGDDQLELLILRLQRGAGGEGIAGMKPVSPSPADSGLQLVRPLLLCSREMLAGYSAERRVRFREDATNACLDHRRNRIRHEVIPILKKQVPPIFETALRSMEIVGAESDFVGATAVHWRQSRNPPFAELHIALQRRIVHDQLRELSLPVEFELIERLRVAAGERFSIGPNLAVSRLANGLLEVHRPSNEAFREESLEVEIGRGGECVFGGLRLYWKVAPGGKGTLSRRIGIEWFDADKVGQVIELRCWRPGDRFQPIGLPHSVKLQDLFVNLKVPAAERRRRVVAVAENKEIFWVEGIRIAEQFKVNINTGRKLKWAWKSA